MRESGPRSSLLLLAPRALRLRLRGAYGRGRCTGAKLGLSRYAKASRAAARMLSRPMNSPGGRSAYTGPIWLRCLLVGDAPLLCATPCS